MSLKLRSARAMGIDVDRLVIDFGVAVLIGLELPIESGVRLVNLEVAIAFEAQEEFESAKAQEKDAKR